MSGLHILDFKGKVVDKLPEQGRECKFYLTHKNKVYQYTNGYWVRIRPVACEFTFLDKKTQKVYQINEQNKRILLSGEHLLLDCSCDVLLRFDCNKCIWKPTCSLEGAQGNQGNQGAQGNDGAQGAQGNQGNDGNDGAQGPQGSIGLTGPNFFPFSEPGTAEGDRFIGQGSRASTGNDDANFRSVAITICEDTTVSKIVGSVKTPIIFLGTVAFELWILRCEENPDSVSPEDGYPDTPTMSNLSVSLAYNNSTTRFSGCGYFTIDVPISLNVGDLIAIKVRFAPDSTIEPPESIVSATVC